MEMCSAKTSTCPARSLRRARGVPARRAPGDRTDERRMIMATITKGGFAVDSAARSWRALAAACLLLALLLALAWPAPVRATTLERMSIEQLSRRATTVVEGAVVSTAVEQTPAGVRTAVRIKVRESLKGAPSALMTCLLYTSPSPRD